MIDTADRLIEQEKVQRDVDRFSQVLDARTKLVARYILHLVVKTDADDLMQLTQTAGRTPPREILGETPGVPCLVFAGHHSPPRVIGSTVGYNC